MNSSLGTQEKYHSELRVDGGITKIEHHNAISIRHNRFGIPIEIAGLGVLRRQYSIQIGVGYMAGLLWCLNSIDEIRSEFYNKQNIFQNMITN